MFTVTYEHALGLLIAVLTAFSLRLAYKIYKDISERHKSNKKFKERKKAVEEMKANGEFHKWMDLPLGHKVIKVCEKTGYVPELDGFIDMFLIEAHKQSMQVEKEYEEYKTKRLEEIATEYKIPVDKMEDLKDAIFGIKKEFTIKRMDDFLKELKVKSEEV